jgi:CRISP-associated protein Cas1
MSQLAKMIITAKISNSILVLDWLRSRYDDNSEKYQSQYDEILKYQKKLPSARTIPEIMGIEGMVARYYFKILNANYEDRLEFNERSNGRSQRSNGATDTVNALFNYGYSILESQCWKAVYSSGLDPGVGFLHETNDGKAPLVYDLQLLERGIIFPN